MGQVNENLKYTQEHEWVLLEGNKAKIGITDFAQSSLGDIVFVELPELDTVLGAGESFGVVESIKSVSDLYTPTSGKVISRNDELEETPEKINESPYDSWLIELELEDDQLAKVKELMDPSEYKNFCENA